MASVKAAVMTLFAVLGLASVAYFAAPFEAGANAAAAARTASAAFLPEDFGARLLGQVGTTTQLATASSVGQRYLPVMSILGIESGDTITIGAGATMEEVTVSGIVANELELLTGCLQPHQAGEAVTVIGQTTPAPAYGNSFPGTNATAWYESMKTDPTESAIQYVINLLVALFFAFIYKIRVVDVMDRKDGTYWQTTVDSYDYNNPAQFKWDQIGLFGCFGDFHTCCLVFWCPYAVAAKNYHVSHTMDFWPACCLIYFSYQCPCIGACLRTHYGSELKHNARIHSSFCVDFCLNLFCTPCEIGRESIFVDEQSYVRPTFCPLGVHDYVPIVGGVVQHG